MIEKRTGMPLINYEIECGIPNQRVTEYTLASRMGLTLSEIRSLSRREVEEFFAVMKYVDEKTQQEMNKSRGNR